MLAYYRHCFAKSYGSNINDIRVFVSSSWRFPVTNRAEQIMKIMITPSAARYQRAVALQTRISRQRLRMKLLAACR